MRENPAPSNEDPTQTKIKIRKKIKIFEKEMKPGWLLSRLAPSLHHLKTKVCEPETTGICQHNGSTD